MRQIVRHFTKPGAVTGQGDNRVMGIRHSRFALRGFPALACLLLGVIGSAGADTTLRNRLADHPSSYLAMHGHDPVRWQVWGEEAWRAAQRENKLLLVSSGYFSCHWCHVMQRESYRDPRIAALLNRHFIPVKVDRELQPALDARLIDFVERTRGQAGWPLNVFITPDGHPLVGTVYLPPERFAGLLRDLAKQWQTRGEELVALARDASEAMASPPMELPESVPPDLGIRYARALRGQALSLADELSGGFGEQSKFPSVPQLQVLLAEVQREADGRLADFLRLSLDQMASQGLRDHLAGGFFRYTVDPQWQIPHFEKMLYDNALLAGLYLQAAKTFDMPRYRAVARETLDFVLQEFAVAGGGYAASLSAIDAQGVEGGYYLWPPEMLERLLTPAELGVARRHWGLEGAPELETGFHLRIAEPLESVARVLKLSPQAARELRDTARRKLLAARSRRSLPRDGKIIAGWNGLLLSALAEAARLPDGARYRVAGRRLRAFLVSRMIRDGRLIRALAGGRAAGAAGIEDYAYVIRGLADWRRLVDPAMDPAPQRRLLDRAWQDFFGDDGWRLSRQSWLKTGYGEPVLADGVMPSPSAWILDATLEGPAGAPLRERARRLLGAGEEGVLDSPFWYATHIEVVRRRIDPPDSLLSGG